MTTRNAESTADANTLAQETVAPVPANTETVTVNPNDHINLPRVGGREDTATSAPIKTDHIKSGADVYRRN